MHTSNNIFRDFWMITHSYSCRSTLGELDLGEDFKEVKFRDHAFVNVFEKLCYSAVLKPICIYCGVDQPFTSEDHYP